MSAPPAGAPTGADFLDDAANMSSPRGIWSPPWLESARHSFWFRLTVGILCALAGVLTSGFGMPMLGVQGAGGFLLLLPFVAFSAGFGGALPGFLTLGILAIALIFPEFSLLSRGEYWLFIGSGALFCLLCGSLNAARGQAQLLALQNQRSRARLQGIFDITNEGVWMLDSTFTTRYVNTQMALLLGTTPEKMLGRPVSDWLFPEDVPVLEKAKISIPQGESHNATRRYKREDGSELWCLVSASPLHDEHGKWNGALALHSDVTASRRQEIERERMNARYLVALDSLGGYLYEVEVSTQSVWRSPNFFQVLGFNEEEVEPTVYWWRARMHPDYGQLHTPYDEILQAVQGSGFTTEYQVRHRDGSWMWVWDRGTVLRDEKTGAPLRIVGTVTDITARKREEKRAGVLARISEILGSSLDLDATLSQLALALVPDYGDWAFVYLKGENQELQLRAIGHASSDQIAAAWGKANRSLALDDKQQSGPVRVFQSGQTEFFEEDEGRFWQCAGAGRVSGTSVPLRFGDRALGVLSLIYTRGEGGTAGRADAEDGPLIEEIARRAAIALENARLYGEVKKADARKDEFLAMLAHELRNPLAAIRGARELIEVGLSPDSRVQTELPRSILDRQSAHLSRLVDDLLDVSRITRGKIELRLSPLDWREVVQSALDAAMPQAAARAHSLEVDLSESSIWIEADRARTLQIAANLLSNAIKYTPPGGHIRVVLRAHDGKATLQVQDNGPGLSPATQERIWNLFEQESRTLDRSEGGLGIGLTLVRSLVELHGGSAFCDSKPGNGSTFCVSLPLAAPPQLEPAQPITESADESTTGVTRKVLVVDDNGDAAAMLKLWLSKQGFQVQMALDGESALEIARDFAPDFALLDVGMPGMNGFELAAKMREQHGDQIQLFALTGYGQEADKIRAFEAGFNRHLTKPVEFDQLLRLLKA